VHSWKSCSVKEIKRTRDEKIYKGLRIKEKNIRKGERRKSISKYWEVWESRNACAWKQCW